MPDTPAVFAILFVALPAEVDTDPELRRLLKQAEKLFGRRCLGLQRVLPCEGGGRGLPRHPSCPVPPPA